MNKTERIKQGVSPIIGNNIRRLREQKHLRNMDLVTKLQLEGIPISTSTLSKIEQGACNPTIAQLIVMRNIFGCDYSDFFYPF
ncbi:MAG: helix-turn-helix domain-containing protein [Acetatifactor sp.]|nr:helix-turn-helix domain-containing protein [Acetatifactor sp.]